MKARPGIALLCAYTLCGVGTTSRAQKDPNRTAPPKLDGLYRGVAFIPQFGAAVGEAYVFSARGDVYRGWPGTQSPATFNFARARSKEPGNTGKYVISGDKITFRWGNNKNETASFHHRRDRQTGKTNMAIGPHHGFKLVPWGKTLEGTFDPATYQAGFPDRYEKHPDLVDDGALSITFWRDGRFTVTDEGARPPVTGRYKVKGAALTLTLPDGEERTYSLHVFEDHKQPPTGVLINGRTFLIKAK